MARLFVAVNFPLELRERLWQAAAPLRERPYPVKWVTAEALHLTVKFLGDVADVREDDLATALSEVARPAKPFDLAVRGFGAFPSADRARVVWAGCEAAPPLELLQHDVERAMHALGFTLEGRPFRPHVTLGRARDGAARREFAALADQLDELEFQADCVISSLDLMQSTLSSQGSAYAVRHAAPLAG